MEVTVPCQQHSVKRPRNDSDEVVDMSRENPTRMFLACDEMFGRFTFHRVLRTVSLQHATSANTFDNCQ